MTPASRIRRLNDAPSQTGRYVLYWMLAHRRLESNFALERAAELALETRLPLVILEPLLLDHPWVNDRLHQFVLDGMIEHAQALAKRPVTYLPFVERRAGEGLDLLERLAASAATVVADDHPSPHLAATLTRASARVSVPFEAVDSNSLIPLRLAELPIGTARAYRAAVQRNLRQQLPSWPSAVRWQDLPAPVQLALLNDVPPPTPLDALTASEPLLASLPIDHTVRPVPLRGGSVAARAQLTTFVATRLSRYASDSSHPDLDATSRLSPYLALGHLSAHQVFEAVVSSEGWTSRRLALTGGGRREGWWGLSASAEAFLDQLVVWRGLAYTTAAVSPEPIDTVAALPGWAQQTLEAHAHDPRPVQYDRSQLETAATHDVVWNAAQREMLETGQMHTYLRMLWGKKILEWSPTPADALETMIALMNRYALDGRDPNSYAGYAWTLGRYDRPWPPAREIFGTVRYMSSANTQRKLKIKKYLTRFR